MVCNHEEAIKKRIIGKAMLIPISRFGEAARRVSIMKDAFFEAGAREEHQKVLDNLYQRTIETISTLTHTYNGLTNGICNLSLREVSESVDSARKKLGRLEVIDRDIDSFCQIAGLYNFKRNPILQIMGSDSLYHSANLESFANN